MKQTGMLVVSLRGVNFGFLYINVANSVSVRVDLRMLRLFPINRRATVYTVEQILEGQTEELQALQQFILRDQGRQ